MHAYPLEAKLDINLWVNDLQHSKKWYSAVFDTKPIFEGEDRSVDGTVVTPMVCFRLGGTKFWLLPKSLADAVHHHQSVGLAFMTSQPLAELRQVLEARGAAFDDTPIPGFPVNDQKIRIGKDAEFIWMVDPDGYQLEFCRVFEFRK